MRLRLTTWCLSSRRRDRYAAHLHDISDDVGMLTRLPKALDDYASKNGIKEKLLLTVASPAGAST